MIGIGSDKNTIKRIMIPGNKHCNKSMMRTKLASDVLYHQIEIHYGPRDLGLPGIIRCVTYCGGFG